MVWVGAKKSTLKKFVCLSAHRSARIGVALLHQERKSHIKLGKSVGVPGTPGGTNRGLPAGVPGISCCLAVKS